MVPNFPRFHAKNEGILLKTVGLGILLVSTIKCIVQGSYSNCCKFTLRVS